MARLLLIGFLFIQPFLSFRDIGRATKPNGLIELTANQVVGQSFVCNFPNLFSIGFYVSLPPKGADGILVFHLKENPEAADEIVSKTIKLSEINWQPKPYQLPLETDLTPEGFFYYVEFDPLVDSGGKHYYFYLEFHPAHDAAKIQIGRFSSFRYPGLREGNLHINHRPSQGNLAFITCCAWRGNFMEVWKTFQVRFTQDRPFAIGYTLLIFLTSLGLAAVTFFKKRSHEGF